MTTTTTKFGAIQSQLTQVRTEPTSVTAYDILDDWYPASTDEMRGVLRTARAG